MFAPRDDQSRPVSDGSPLSTMVSGTSAREEGLRTLTSPRREASLFKLGRSLWFRPFSFPSPGAGVPPGSQPAPIRSAHVLNRTAPVQPCIASVTASDSQVVPIAAVSDLGESALPPSAECYVDSLAAASVASLDRSIGQRPAGRRCRRGPEPPGARDVRGKRRGRGGGVV
jgi:hypothetical protein